MPASKSPRQPEEFWLTARDGFPLFTRCWRADPPVSGVVAFVHGLGEHTGRYEEWADWFGSSGFTFLAHDQRGHGMSGGRRCYVRQYATLLSDVEVLLGKARSLAGRRPVFLYGHSLGGNIAINYLLRCQADIAGAIVASPLLELTRPVLFWKRWAVRTCSLIYPYWEISNGIGQGMLSHDEQANAAYQDDSLIHHAITARLAAEAFAAARWVIEHASRLRDRVLFLHGDRDAITSCARTQAFAGQCGDLAECKVWEGQYHELHREPVKREVFDFIITWMRAMRDNPQ